MMGDLKRRLRRRLGLGRVRSAPAGDGEDGYILLAVLFMVVLVLIALSVAAPKVAADIERDREVELMHRGQQYRRAIKMYYKKFGAYPPNMDALEKTSEIRFLRKRYKDPETGKDEWHLIHFGENKMPTTYGFFGQAMAGSGGTLAGTGPGGVGQNIGSPAGGSSFGGSSFGGSSAGGSSFGGSSFGGSSLGGSGNLGSGSNSGIGGSSSGTSSNGSSGTDSGSTSSGSSTSGSTSGSTGDSGSANGGTGSTSGGSSSIFGSSTSSGSGQTFGGGGIIGVESTSPKVAILEYRKKKHFNEWEFVYDPQQDQMQIGGNTGAVGQPMSGAGNSTTGSPTSPSLLNNSPGSSFGSPSTGSSSPSSPTSPSPQ